MAGSQLMRRKRRWDLAPDFLFQFQMGLIAKEAAASVPPPLSRLLVGVPPFSRMLYIEPIKRGHKSIFLIAS